MRIFYFILFVSFFNFSNAQDYNVKNIDAALLKNANAVVRNETTKIILKDFDSKERHYSIAITAINRSGLGALDPYIYYSGNDKVKEISAVLYDKKGKVIKKFKEKDFSDLAASGSSLYTDNRLKSLEYITPGYPFTLHFTYTLKSGTTGFIKLWKPRDYYNVSVEKSTYEVVNEKQVPLEKKEYNLEGLNLDVKNENGNLYYSVANMPAVDREFASPHYSAFFSMVRVGLKKFQLENSVAEVTTWKDFGTWQNEALLNGRDGLSEETKAKVSSLVKDLKTDREKVKAIYEYMQNKTRYISVQVGIGGWQPATAEEVDELGYGDCKGLTNYTKALLKSQGIPSYYTIVECMENGTDIDEDLVAMQGDHVILAVPLEDKNLFLECTSQDIPFGFLGTHTDDRKVVMMTPDGGVIAKTPTYSKKDNISDFSALVQLDDALNLSGKVTEISKYLVYDLSYGLKDLDKEELDKYYKNIWGHLNGLTVFNISLENDKDNITFTERYNFNAKNYVSKAGDRILINPNVFNRFDYVPTVHFERKQGVSVRRGQTIKNKITWKIPEGYIIEAMFDAISITNEFGAYEASIEKLDSNTLVYNRKVIINAIDAPKESFKTYEAFIKARVKGDQSKIVLVKK